MYDVTAIGELLIDFTPLGPSAQGRPVFEQNPGGAPANVLAALSQLGRTTALISKVGKDPFGISLRHTLEQAGIETQGLLMSDTYLTTLAFVHLDQQGDRSFSFYRQSGADVMLEASEIAFNLIDDCRVFHFGSVSMTDDPTRQATLAAVHYAYDRKKLISFDPNLRPMLWHSLTEARRLILSILPQVDCLKVSDEELFFLTETTDLRNGTEQLISEFDLQLVLVTQGRKGAYGRTPRVEGHHRAYDVPTIDTTGAGDAFTGSVLHDLLRVECDPAQLSETELMDLLARANAAGSLATTRKGAIPAMPSSQEIDTCLQQIPILTISE